MSGRQGLLFAVAPLAALLLFALGSRLTFAPPEEDPLSGQGIRQSVSMEVRRTEEPASSEDQRAIEQVVTGHLHAIRRGDFAGALDFAAPSVRRDWNPERFGVMVNHGYGPLRVAKTIECADVRRSQESGRLLVTVRSEGARPTQYQFHLLRLDGRWFIDSCQPMDGLAPPLAPGAL